MTDAHTRADAAVDTDFLFEALRRVAADFVSLVLETPDSAVPVRATPGWTVADVFVHVASEVPRYEEDALGTGQRAATPKELSRENRRTVAALATDDLQSVADQMVRDLASLEATIRSLGDSVPHVVFDGGASVRADVAVGSLLGEFIVHGDDIAQALHERWVIDPTHVPMVIEALNAILPGWVNPEAARGHTAVYEVRLRRTRRSYFYEFRDGEVVVVDVPARRADLRITGRPGDILLAMYSRRSPTRQLLTGRVVAHGRRPWLAPRFGSLFFPP